MLCTLKFDNDIRENLRRHPPKLEKLYAVVYAELKSQRGNIGRSIIENTFKWLLSARRTMNASIFLWAIALNLETTVGMEEVLELCHNLVIYDEGLRIFRFAHLSVREFLEKMPEFSENFCNALAAEHCLIHLIASSESSNATFELWKIHIRTIHERLLSVEPSARAGFMDYSFDSWMFHCGLASQDARLGDASFGQTFRFFLSELPIHGSAFDEWVQRYSNTLPEKHTNDHEEKLKNESRWQLHGLLYRYPNATLRIFFVAVAYGFSEITKSYLQKERLGEKESKQAVLLAENAGQKQVFGLLTNIKDMEVTAEVLLGLLKVRDKETLEGLQSKVPSSCFTEQTFHTAIGIEDKWYLNWLLQQHPRPLVTQRMLTDAIMYGDTYTFELLLDRTPSTIPLDVVLHKAIVRHAMAEIKLILAKAGSSCLNPTLMAYAAGRFGHVAIMEVILTHGGASTISEDVVVNAARNDNYSGSVEMLKLTLVHGGKITQNVLLENAWNVSAEILDILLQHGCEINIGVLEACINSLSTEILSFDALLSHVEDSVIAPEIARLLWTLANRRSQDKSCMIKQLLDRSDKLGMDQDTFRLLRAVVDSGCGRAELIERLMDRTHKTAIAAEMTNLLLDLASNICRPDDVEMMRPLLHRAESSAVTEDVFLGALSNINGNHMLPMLWEKTNTIAITEDVLSQALRNLDSNVIWDVLALVETSNITGDLLAAAAANKFCGDAIVKDFLQEADLAELPVEVVLSAIKNHEKGEEVMVALEQSFGPIELTEHILLSLFRIRDVDSTFDQNPLQERIKPEHITEKVLIAAIGSGSKKALHVITPKSNHVPITLDVLKAAMRSGQSGFSRFFWNRAHLSEVPQTLIQAAAESYYGIFKFVLTEAKEVRSEEDLFMAIARQGRGSIEMFELLLERDIPLRITSNVIRAAVAKCTTESAMYRSLRRSPIQ